jgi:hypothetical protein
MVLVNSTMPANASKEPTIPADLVITLQTPETSPLSPTLQDELHSRPSSQSKDVSSRLGRPPQPTCTQPLSSPTGSAAVQVFTVLPSTSLTAAPRDMAADGSRSHWRTQRVCRVCHCTPWNSEDFFLPALFQTENEALRIQNSPIYQLSYQPSTRQVPIIQSAGSSSISRPCRPHWTPAVAAVRPSPPCRTPNPTSLPPSPRQPPLTTARPSFLAQLAAQPDRVCRYESLSSQPISNLCPRI